MKTNYCKGNWTKEEIKKGVRCKNFKNGICNIKKDIVKCGLWDRLKSNKINQVSLKEGDEK